MDYCPNFVHPVDCNGRRADSCGISGTGETPQAFGAEEAHRPPRGKRSAWNENQRHPST
ncbi:Ribose 5-phosphate isomerase B [Bacillus badius]|uniref:Ribose 5-phosphate isomerase B n=1 Tax=Bacillus badius TaxID=1455 RepID=A0ABR5B098_BACBA|nr:Ribose 5-phosphate isomerase B [Bacillus badius]